MREPCLDAAEGMRATVPPGGNLDEIKKQLERQKWRLRAEQAGAEF